MDEFERDDRQHIANTYSRQPILLIEGKGVMVKDSEGETYIDCFSGIAVNNVGHCHPRVVEAINKQTSKLIHTSNIYHTEPQIKLAKLLSNISGRYQSFFCNSGAEAIEAAIKLVRKATGKTEIIVAENSFHGRTMAALSATGQHKYQKGFEPLLKGFKYVPFGESEAIKSTISTKTGAVLLEPIQGEGGVILPPENYLSTVATLCKKKEALLVLDEVQTGFGRTGEMFAWQGYGVEPDIFTIAKALGGGIPIGAMLAKKSVMSAFEPGNHASTFGGNPVTCSAAVASVEVIIEENLSEKAKEIGDYFIKGLLKLKNKYPFIKDVRGKGLMIGVELDRACHNLVDSARQMGLLLNCANENVLRFTPPLIIKQATIDIVLNKLEKILQTIEHD
jgi:acetylornithine/N-succinyldiaminopimelate aminotransferase